MILNAIIHAPLSLGKGEVDSSILSGSTTNGPENPCICDRNSSSFDRLYVVRSRPGSLFHREQTVKAISAAPRGEPEITGTATTKLRACRNRLRRPSPRP